MKKHLAIAAGIVTCAALFMSATPAMAADIGVGVNIGLPGVYVQQRPEYVNPRYENDWRGRRERARQWREQQAHERHDEHRDDHRDRGEHRGHDD
jgi:hypothetical protein